MIFWSFTKQCELLLILYCLLFCFLSLKQAFIKWLCHFVNLIKEWFDTLAQLLTPAAEIWNPFTKRVTYLPYIFAGHCKLVQIKVTVVACPLSVLFPQVQSIVHTAVSLNLLCFDSSLWDLIPLYLRTQMFSLFVLPYLCSLYFQKVSQKWN